MIPTDAGDIKKRWRKPSLIAVFLNAGDVTHRAAGSLAEEAWDRLMGINLKGRSLIQGCCRCWNNRRR